MTEWISVKDRLPENYKNVLCVSKFLDIRDITVAHCWESYQKESFWMDTHSFPLTDITHWMPLPEPPNA